MFLLDGRQDLFQADVSRDVFTSSLWKPLWRIWAVDDGLHHLLNPWAALLWYAVGTQVIEVPFWELVLCFCFCVQEQNTHLSVVTLGNHIFVDPDVFVSDFRHKALPKAPVKASTLVEGVVVEDPPLVSIIGIGVVVFAADVCLGEICIDAVHLCPEHVCLLGVCVFDCLCHLLAWCLCGPQHNRFLLI